MQINGITITGAIVKAPPIGQVEYVTAGTYDWTAPEGVFSVSVIVVGPGGSGYGVNMPNQGGGGSGGGGTSTTRSYNGGAYGGGSGGRFTGSTNNYGSGGVVRIIWPGDTRQFPSTRTANE